MNYYEKHIGDYIKDTVSLTMIEDGAYNRLIDAYYAKELPLPADLAKVFKAARALTRVEKNAVEAVLDEFFTLTPEGYRHKRCDEEIERYQISQEGADSKREADKIRQDRARERRKALFEQLRSHGIVAPWDAKTHELEAHLSRVTKTQPSQPVTRDKSEPVTRDNTATHTPVPSHQTPDTNPHQGGLQPPRTPPLSADDADAPPPAAEKPVKARPKAKASAEPAPTSKTWDAYASAYGARYGATPVRNAQVNGQLSQLVARIGAEEAPAVAAFFLTHNNLLYVRAMHPVPLLLRDCEKLRTEWATNRRVTSAQATAADRTQTNANAFAPLIAEAAAREASHGIR